MTQFVCIAKFTSKPGQENNLIKALSSLLEPTRAESGCISYDLHRDVHQPEVLTMIEFFKSKEDFEFHSKQDYLLKFRESATGFFESVNLTFCTKI